MGTYTGQFFKIKYENILILGNLKVFRPNVIEKSSTFYKPFGYETLETLHHFLAQMERVHRKYIYLRR